MEAHPVEIREFRVLRGPNLFAYMPVIKAVMDIGPYEEQHSALFPGFIERLTTWLPGLERHECSVGRPGGFIERLQRGTYFPHIVEHITLELQTLMGFDVVFGRARGTGERGVYNVVVEYKEEESARAAFHTAMRLVQGAMHDLPFDAQTEIEQLLETADQWRLGPSTAAIVQAARKKRIPVVRLTEQGSLIQLGYGVYQKRILASETSNTSAIAVDICQDKPLTNSVLSAVGVPVPEGRRVQSADAAWEAAQEIGLPVVVKPDAGNQGKAVSVNLNSEQEVRAAYEITREFGPYALVERYVWGHDYRLLVVNSKLVAAARRDPAHVTGDSKHTIQELVEEANKDPRRRPGHSSILTRLAIDDVAQIVLEQQGMAADSIPEAGQIVRLRNNSNLSTGGTATDVTDVVHPANVRIAELAAEILALDVAGIDVICEDITRPLSEQGGAIVEVNVAPGLRMHLAPAEGPPRQVGIPIVEMLYPDDTPSRIPIIAVTGTNGKTTVTRLIGHMYETARWMVGVTSTEGAYINRERIFGGDSAGPKSARAILMHPHVEVAVLETARGGILREGLAFDECSVAVVTNISSDHLGVGGVNTLDELAAVKQVVVENVARDGCAVLNADDSRVAQMAASTDARVIYFSVRADNPILQSHLAEGGWGVFCRHNKIALATGDEAELELVDLEQVPFTVGGKIQFQVQNALAAVAAAWGAGLNPAMIVRALTTFETTADAVPGRFNRFELNGVEVILDYGHNAAAMKALAQAIDILGERRTVMVIGLPGDRRDEDLIATFEETRPIADEYFLHDLELDQRGRRKHEIPKILKRRLAKEVAATIVATQQEGILRAWKQVKPGDRLVVIADLVDKSLETLDRLAESISHDASCDMPLALRFNGYHSPSSKVGRAKL